MCARSNDDSNYQPYLLILINVLYGATNDVTYERTLAHSITSHCPTKRFYIRECHDLDFFKARIVLILTAS